MATQKAITGNVQRKNGGTVAFATSASGPITSVVGKTLLNVTQTRDNLPVDSGVAGYAAFGVTKMNNSYDIAYKNAGFLFRGFPYSIWGVTSIKNRGITTGTSKPLSVHTRTTRKIRVITGWDYVTGAAEGVSVDSSDFGRDDAVTKTTNGEFVFIPSGGRLPSRDSDNSKYYTYTRLY